MDLNRRQILAPFVVVVAVLGTAGVTGASDRDPWASLHRPLQLKPPLGRSHLSRLSETFTRQSAELHIDTSRTVGSYSKSRWGTTVSMLLVRAHGCYGPQLDSARGTGTIVVRGS